MFVLGFRTAVEGETAPKVADGQVCSVLNSGFEVGSCWGMDIGLNQVPVLHLIFVLLGLSDRVRSIDVFLLKAASKL